jgi:hypothetical protein
VILSATLPPGTLATAVWSCHADSPLAPFLHDLSDGACSLPTRLTWVHSSLPTHALTCAACLIACRLSFLSSPAAPHRAGHAPCFYPSP